MVLSKLFTRLASTRKLVVTGTGKDRLGIVGDISHLIHQNHGSIIDSSMSYLWGNFAAMMLVQIPQNTFQAFKQEINLQSQNLAVHLRCQNAIKETVQVPKTYQVGVNIEGVDQQNIIFYFPEYLKSLGVCFEALGSGTYTGAMGGTTLFWVEAQLLVPESVSLEELKGYMGQAEDEYDVDIKISKDKQQLYYEVQNVLLRLLY